jgi:hypothetical protein
LQLVATAAQTALTERSRQTHLISAEDSKVLDVEMHRAWTTLLMRLDAGAMLSHDRHPTAVRSEELVKLLFYSDGPECLQDTYVAQLAMMRRMLQRIKDDKLENELDELCSPPFLAWIRAVLPRYRKIVNTIENRDGEPLVNLLVHRNALSRAVITYATAMCLTVNEEEDDTIEQAYKALAPMDDLHCVTLRNDLTATDAPERPASLANDEAPLPA